jgi:hypothetical protein
LVLRLMGGLVACHPSSRVTVVPVIANIAQALRTHAFCSVLQRGLKNRDDFVGSR